VNDMLLLTSALKATKEALNVDKKVSHFHFTEFFRAPVGFEMNH